MRTNRQHFIAPSHFFRLSSGLNISPMSCRVQVAARKGEGALKVTRQDKSEAEDQQLQKSFATLWRR